MDAQLKDMKVKVYLNALASDAKVPGGGSASALVGSLAASLTSMTSNIIKAKTEESDPLLALDMKNLAQRAEHLRLMLEGCIEEDAKMFELLMASYNLPKDVEGRTERLQRSLKNAASVPVKIATLSCKVLDLCKDLLPQVKGLKISDVGTAAVMAQSAINGAVLAVKINTYMIKDTEYAAKVNKQVEDLAAKYKLVAEEIFEKVSDRITR